MMCVYVCARVCMRKLDRSDRRSEQTEIRSVRHISQWTMLWTAHLVRICVSNPVVIRVVRLGSVLAQIEHVR